ncbi:MAG TPA: carboxypeptidase regulatory-like domain-containing protein [Gemmatimonadaceae bacterium]|nr:carboxypeptidase regulatory-like domain-containing protein [Gemmatimonadaceae bacterium]
MTHAHRRLPASAAGRRFARTALLAAALLAPSRARAQDLPPVPKDLSSLIGAVDDSIRGGRLKGAIVTVVGTERRGVTDANGIFQIDSIPPGTHELSVTHPLLDTLGVQIHSAPFTLVAGQRTEVTARSPTFEEIRAKSCPRGGLVAGPGILVGRVLKADTEDPAAGASVSLVYTDVSQKEAVQKVRTGRVAANGAFSICGLPTTIAGNLQATFGGVTTADVPITANDESISTAILLVGGTGPGRAVISGTVTARGGQPVAGAQVAIAGTPSVVETSAAGKFTLGGLPAGTQEAVVRKLGFAKVSQIVHLNSANPTNISVVLDPATVLGTVRVVGQMETGLTKIGFLARKQLGRGWFLTPEQIADKNPNQTTDLFRLAPGMNMINTTGGRYLTSTSTIGSTSDGCINVFIDRARFDQFQPGDVDDAIPTADLGAVEYYQRPSDVPTEFDVPGKSCATLIVWTKTMLTTLKGP